ncbi:hypothetical protein N187_00905 [Borrelia anserina Es]|uniref:Uncharacterized protein n=1 Tax=Borrelia anserina Es TaxID=1365188 RepID=A0ABM6FTU6_BORAN|nr:hypothetical protein N187_00905 [Borrelia anserina Es]
MIAVNMNSNICKSGILIYSYVPKTLLFVMMSVKFLENINPNAKYIKNIGFFLSNEFGLNVKKNVNINNGKT